MRAPFVSFLLSLIVALVPLQSRAQTKPDILVLGDSQISFGAGQVFVKYFKNLQNNCAGTGLNRNAISKLGKRDLVAVGVRSTSLHSWTARSGAGKNTICDIDKKYGVNAGVFSTRNPTKAKFVQIGQTRGFDYCEPNKSAFEGLFSNPASAPKLLVLNFLGNAESRWAGSQSAANADVATTLAQIPKTVPCIILTTAPVFSKSTNDKRMAAQTSLERAVAKSGGHCQLVKGFSAQSRAAIEGKPQFFKRNAAGKVTDPHHPNVQAVSHFMDAASPAMCSALATVLK